MFGKVWFTIDGTSKMPFLKFFPFSLFKILNAYCQKFCVKTILFYNEFRGFLWSSTTSQIYLKYLFLTMKPTALLITFFQICEEILFASFFKLWAGEYAISFFLFLFMFILTRLWSKTLWRNYHFLKQISFQDLFQHVVYYRILGCQTLWY